MLKGKTNEISFSIFPELSGNRLPFPVPVFIKLQTIRK